MEYADLKYLSVELPGDIRMLRDAGEFEKMKIYWKDDLHLVINSLVYEIE